MAKRLIVAGWHHDSNLGDAAIVAGLSAEFESSLTGWRLTLQGAIHHTRPDFRTLASVSGTLANVDEEPLSALFRGDSVDPFGISRHVIALLCLLRSVLVLLAPRTASLLLSAAERRTLRAYLAAEGVVGKGGQYLFDTGSIASAGRLYVDLFPFLLARRLGLPYALLGISVGPIHHSFLRWLVRFVVEGSVGVSCRESRSTTRLKALCGADRETAGRIVTTGDYAFAAPFVQAPPNLQDGRDEPAGSGRRDTRTVVLIPRERFPGDPGDRAYEEFLGAMAALTDRLLTMEGIQVAVAYTTSGTGDLGEDDRGAGRRIAEAVGGDSRVSEWERERNPSGLVDRLAGAGLVVATRLHGAIFSLLAGVPVILLSYFGPKAAIMSDLGLEECLFDLIDMGSESTVERMVARCRELLGGSIGEEKLREVVARQRALVRDDPAKRALLTSLER